MAYFTGKDVDVWVTTEHEHDYIYVDGGLLKVGVGDETAGNNITSTTLLSGSLNQAGKSNNRLTDVSGCDVSIGAVDEDISFFGLRNVGKIEVKKDTSVTITRKKSDNRNMQAFQGTTLSTDSYDSVGNHGARWGLIYDGSSKMDIANGTVDPKSSKDDSAGGDCCYGFRVFVELKGSTTAHGVEGNGVVLIIPNCTMMEYSSTVSNESANEETITFSSMVKPIIWTGDIASTENYDTGAITQTLAADM
jgi:light-regulated signal transduction histidine kinase (bacteriophytochrome)